MTEDKTDQAIFYKIEDVFKKDLEYQFKQDPKPLIKKEKPKNLLENSLDSIIYAQETIPNKEKNKKGLLSKILDIGAYASIIGSVLLGFYICGDNSNSEIKQYFPNSTAFVTGMFFALYGFKRLGKKYKK
jgi:hypothetical protein